MAPDGSGWTAIAGTRGATGVPAWSPDSRRLAFSAAEGGHQDLVVIGADGRDRTRLTRGREGLRSR